MPVGDRPRQPQLSAAATRSINRNPLTPKIAAKGPATPLPRRPHPSTPTLANNQSRDDVASPAAVSFFGNNITPRSGQRQTRVESTSSTPSGTPNPERTSDGWDNNNIYTNRSGLGISPSPLANDLPRQAASQVDLTTDPNESGKFFYASDAKSVQPAGPPRPASVPQKPVTFFYANGSSVEGGSRAVSPPSNAPFSPVMSTNQESLVNKFFYANGTPDISLRPNPPTSGSVSAVSTNSRMAPLRPIVNGSNSGNTAAPQRPASPIKAASTPVTQTLKSTSPSPTSPKRASLTQQASSSAAQRRVSIDTAPKEAEGHHRKHSAPTMEPAMMQRFAISPKLTESPSISPPLSPALSKTTMTMASILQAADELADGEESRAGDARSSEVQSPTKSLSISDSVSDLVANARRERKVQDLEITNASLEAINRTLERQLRKQTAELRRFRRLSRSGAFSAASSRVTSLAMSEPPVDMSDMSDEDDSEDEEIDSVDDSDLSSNDTTSTEDILRPGARAEARRRRDERRLQLDLTKHQELLIDSQKMNQSLKRCLDFTDLLIKEGQKALQYHVRVSDVEFGGRVLAPPDDDDDRSSYLGEETARDDKMALEPPRTKSSQDRDSGIELQGS